MEKELLQLLNTAIIKSKEKCIDSSYEERLKATCDSPAISAISVAVDHLAESSGVSRDQAALKIVETFKELESIWTDYVVVEGINSLKSFLKDSN